MGHFEKQWNSLARVILRSLIVNILTFWSFLVSGQSTYILPGGDSPNFFLESTSNGGIVPPRMTSSQIQSIVNPAEGTMVYDTESHCIRIFDGNSWQCQGDGSIKEIEGYQIGGNGDQIAHDIVARNGFLYLVGEFDTEIVFQILSGPQTFNSTGMKDGFLAKLDYNGKLIWFRQFTNSLNLKATQIEFDNSGNIYVGGMNYGSAQIGPIGLANDNIGADIFFAKYNPAGDFQWIQKIGGSGTDTLTAMCVDTFNQIHLVGGFENTTYFYGAGGAIQGIHSSQGYKDFFYGKYDLAGGYISSQCTGSSFGDEIATAVARMPNGKTLIAGSVLGPGGSVTFGGFQHYLPGSANKGLSSGFMIVFGSSGIAEDIFGTGSYWIDQIAVNSVNGVYISSGITYNYLQDPNRNIPFWTLKKFTSSWFIDFELNGFYSSKEVFGIQPDLVRCNYANSMSQFPNSLHKSTLFFLPDDRFIMAGNIFCSFSINAFHNDNLLTGFNYGFEGSKSFEADKMDVAMAEYDVNGASLFSHHPWGGENEFVRSGCSDTDGRYFLTGDFDTFMGIRIGQAFTGIGREIFVIKFEE